MIIDNTLRSVFVAPDNLLNEYTKLAGDIEAGTTVISVTNNSGFVAEKSLYIGDIGGETSELTGITSIGTDVIYITATKLSHKNRDKVYLTEFNQVNFYENGTLVTTTTIQADYYTRIDYYMDIEKEYQIEFQNNLYYGSYGTASYGWSLYGIGSATSENRESKYGYERNLCSVGDIYSYERPDNISFKLISKIDIASREIRNLFISQDQLFTDLSDNQIELLRQPTALLALYYSWNELIKAPDDISSLKASNYKLMYDAKIKEVLDVISKKNSNISMFGQARFER
jgi:uncharacterized protein YggL (DUF469 family)